MQPLEDMLALHPTGYEAWWKMRAKAERDGLRTRIDEVTAKYTTQLASANAAKEKFEKWCSSEPILEVFLYRTIPYMRNREKVSDIRVPFLRPLERNPIGNAPEGNP
jgi:hypothetical protein